MLFRPAPQGSRNGLRVLVMEEGDAPGGGYTVKVDESEKVVDVEGGFQHTRIVLKPLNPEFDAVPLAPVEGSSEWCEFVEVLGLPQFEALAKRT